MKKDHFRFLLLMLLFAVFFNCCSQMTKDAVQPQAKSNDQNSISTLSKSSKHGPSVSGAFTWIRKDNVVKRILTFQAKTNDDGSVTGHGQMQKFSSDPSLNYHLKFEIDCLNVQGNVAIVSGIITKSDEDFFPGRRFQFKLIDNGEGANSVKDQFTHMANWGPDEEAVDCGTDVGWNICYINSGNIQVKS